MCPRGAVTTDMSLLSVDGWVQAQGGDVAVLRVVKDLPTERTQNRARL